MKVVGIGRIVNFARRYPDAKSQLDSWLSEAKEANWTAPIHIKRRYQQVSFLANNRVVFNIRGNNYRLVTIVDYETKIVVVESVLTHPEYSRLKF